MWYTYFRQKKRNIYYLMMEVMWPKMWFFHSWAMKLSTCSIWDKLWHGARNQILIISILMTLKRNSVLRSIDWYGYLSNKEKRFFHIDNIHAIVYENHGTPWDYTLYMSEYCFDFPPKCWFIHSKYNTVLQDPLNDI